MSSLVDFISRPGSWLFLVFCVFSQVSLVQSSSCAPPPIPIHLGNVSLATSQTARGLNISVGSPAQPFAFLPAWPLNNTMLYGTNGYCSSTWTTAACTTFRGGAYNEAGSTSQGTPATNQFPVDGQSYPPMSMITDNITLNSNFTMGSFPMGIAQEDWGEQGYHPQMAIGLGSNSTILNALKAAGKIASRSWSMFYGRIGGTSSTQLDGNFVFGGYDRAKVTGQNYTSYLTNSQTTTCTTRMIVSITDLILNFPNGTNYSLMGGIAANAISACLVPDYPVLMTLPLDPYFSDFQLATSEDISDRSFGLYYYGMLYEAGEATYKGDLTITLDSGLSVRIPNDQLVVPNLNLNTQTGQWVANGTTPELVLNSLQSTNAANLPQIGRQFLTAAYVMMNLDTNQFTLWEANATSDTDYVALDSSNNVYDSSNFCSAVTTTTGEGNATTSGSGSAGASSSPPVVTKSSGIGSGAIAGIVVGAVAVVAILAGVAFRFLRKRRNDTKYSAANPSSPTFAPQPETSDGNGFYGHYKPQQPQEMPTGRPVMPTSEMDGVSNYRHEVVGDAPRHELP